MPSLKASHLNLIEALKSGTRSSGQSSALRGRRLLVAVQISFAFGLMVVAGVLIRSILESRTLDRALLTKGIITLKTALPPEEYSSNASTLNFYEETANRIRSLPEIVSAALVSRRPLAASARAKAFFIEGRALEPEQAPFVGTVVADPEYLGVAGIPLLKGSFPAPTSRLEIPKGALINADVARLHWPDKDPIGNRFKLSSREEWFTIVGVVGDVAIKSSNGPAVPLVYLPLSQNPRRRMALYARYRGNLESAVASLRSGIREVDPYVPILDIRTMEQIYSDSVAPSNLLLTLLTTFAAFALLMAAAGIYAVASFSTTQRTREFGIRMALGAEKRSILSLVVGQSVWVILGGLLLGTAIGIGLVQLMASGLQGVQDSDLATYLLPAAFLAAIAFLSCFLPARKASRVDPVTALRAE